MCLTPTKEADELQKSTLLVCVFEITGLRSSNWFRSPIGPKTDDLVEASSCILPKSDILLELTVPPEWFPRSKDENNTSEQKHVQLFAHS